MFEKIRNPETENQQYRDEIKKMRKKIAYYESENMSTSTTSNYNDARRIFRENRGENPKGGPGEKINNAVEDADDNGGDECTRGPNGKKIGPPIGHTGVSHHKPPIHHCIIIWIQNNVHAAKRHLLGYVQHASSYTTLMHIMLCSAPWRGSRGPNAHAAANVRAPNPFLDGTSLGPFVVSHTDDVRRGKHR